MSSKCHGKLLPRMDAVTYVSSLKPPFGPYSLLSATNHSLTKCSVDEHVEKPLCPVAHQLVNLIIDDSERLQPTSLPIISATIRSRHLYILRSSSPWALEHYSTWYFERKGAGPGKR
ncbi:predicted protein [Plenodomus lingam JN3]|uniref:Predicted protein n=1 Tax=Leptosphaeria maculans (strain JN3 / isolate v23.1.3 / race Av1-4-5-6-7-8) TaxID=985895 RepID=E4ZSV1_LEPMJ|nr:predicted protein [Plenodomus lingam JN3]CBX94539.1 predicted protein [Plenodomus lingam JN3]